MQLPAHPSTCKRAGLTSVSSAREQAGKDFIQLFNKQPKDRPANPAAAEGS